MPPTAATVDGVPRDADRRSTPAFEVDRAPARTFVPVDELAGLERVLAREAPIADGMAADDDLVTIAPGPNGWSLWGDPEP